MSAADLIRGAKLRTDEFRVCVDPDLVDEHARLQADLAADKATTADSFAGGGRSAEIQARIDGVLEEMEASIVTLVLRALPRREYRAMLDAHPPRKDADGKTLPRDERYGVDYDAFYNELARRSILGSRVDEKTIEDLDAETIDLLIEEKLSDGQWEDLTSRCHRLNRTTVDVPFSPAGSPKRRRSSGR